MKIEKISFYMADSRELSAVLEALSEEEKAVAEEAINYYLSFDSDFEFAFAVSDGALIIRVFDMGRYFFVFPIPLCDEADIALAIRKTVRYSIIEELEPVFSAVPAEDISLFASSGYRHLNIDADSPDASEYRVTIKNELHFLDEIEELTGEKITLSPLAECDASVYARLCCDAETNKFMGYDWTVDYPDADDKTFFEIAARELNYCTSLTLAVRAGEVTVGDVALHNFDCMGGADISVRILPEERRKGYAKEAVNLLLDFCSGMGLTKLYARVDNRNLSSLALFSAEADKTEVQEEITVYTYDLIQ